MTYRSKTALIALAAVIAFGSLALAQPNHKKKTAANRDSHAVDVQRERVQQCFRFAARSDLRGPQSKQSGAYRRRQRRLQHQSVQLVSFRNGERGDHAPVLPRYS